MNAPYLLPKYSASIRLVSDVLRMITESGPYMCCSKRLGMFRSEHVERGGLTPYIVIAYSKIQYNNA